MRKRTAGWILGLALCGAVLGAAPAQQPVVLGVERGLEDAVKWKWTVVPSDEKLWGLELPPPPPAAPLNAALPAQAPRSATDSYEVKKGDALVLIGKKFGLTVAQLKAANGLTNDMIRIGEVLKIPTLEECIALGLPPEPPKPKTVPGAKPGKSDPANQLDQEVFLLQIYLDREGFSSGPISGKTNLDFQKLVYLYQVNHPELETTDQLQAKALAGVGEMLTTYTLKYEDFRFIAPPKAQAAPAPGATATPAPTKKPPKAAAKPTPVPPPAYAEMTASPMLAYRSPWEFVAERFHCREDLLRQLNPGLKPLPAAGTEFRVPNVVPFAIENAFALPLQPPADPQQVVTAAIVDLSRIEIYRNDRLVAVMPVFPARPGLRGRGTWKILDAVPRPRLATLQEEKDTRPPTNSFYKGENPEPEPEHPVLKTPEYLPAGPNNPIGIFWVNLSKSENLEPLPYGLHGTGIPSELKTRYGLGGFRLTNWDIARAVRLLPVGTNLNWKQPSPIAPPPARPAL